ncbi:MAG: tripartite tricarboxylate transporter permease [Chloroflexota bacterium]
MFEAAGAALSHIATWQVLVALLGGTIVGVMSGALPGGAVPTLVVLLGFAYGMDPFIALPLAIGMVATVPTGDTLPAVLLGMPGSTSGQATILDGYPLSQKGKAGEALAAAYLASLIGGAAGAAFLFVTIPFARPVVNSFGAAEFFILGMVAIAVVGVVSSGAILRGLIAGTFGLLIASVGYDQNTGTSRITFGVNYLWDGIPIVPVVIGLFALPEFFDLIVADQPIAGQTTQSRLKEAMSGRGRGMKAVLSNWPLVLRSSALGVFVGVLPGIGGSLAQWLAYASARQTVRGGTQTFGTGDIRGVIAPESANNAVDGGSLVPTLFFGVPGSVGMAIFLGFLVVLGLQPGPSMLHEHLDLTLTIAFSLVLCNAMATALMLTFTPQLTKVAFVRPNVLVPIVFVVLAMAAFQAKFSVLDLVVMLAFGGLGFFMKTYGWPRPPIIIAVILGSIIERFYAIAAKTYGLHMFTRIPVLLIIAIAVGMGLYTVWMQRSVARSKQEQDVQIAAMTQVKEESVAQAPAPETTVQAVKQGLDRRLRPTANGLMLGLVAAAALLFFFNSFDWPWVAARLPRLVSVAAFVLIGIYLVRHLIRPPAARGRIMDIGRSATDASPKEVRRRTIKAIGTTVGFVLGIWLIGFQITVPVYIAGYLYFFGKVRWWVALLWAAAFVAMLHFFFSNVINVVWPTPVLDAILPGFLIGQ